MPFEVRTVRLGKLVEDGVLAITDGYRVKNSELGDTGIPFVRGGDIREGWIDTNTLDHIRPELAQRVESKLTRAGDVAFITKGTVGRAGRLRPGQPAVVFAPQVAYWRVLDSEVLDPNFLFYLTRTREFQAALDAVKSHGAMVADYVSISQQLDFAFDFPDIFSQRGIGEALGAVDDRIDLLRKTNATLEAIAQALFKSWFVDFDPVRAKAEGREPEGMDAATAALFPAEFEESALGLIPKGWQVRSLDSFAKFLNGLALQKFPPESEEEYLPVIKIAQLRAGSADRADRASARLKPEYVVRDGDVLFSWSGSLEVEFWCGGDGALNQHLFKVTSDEVPKWFYYLATRRFLPSFREIASHKATTMGHIQRKHLAEARMALPQPSTVCNLGRLVAPLLERRIANALQARVLANLRDTLLPRLISGKLRLPEAQAQLEEALA